jgi:predicted glycosyltransferase
VLVLGLRDILDHPDVVRQQWERDGSLDAIDELYDAVLIYGERRLFDVAAAYGLSPQARARVRYCGYVCHPMGTGSSPEREDQSRLILAVAGGGADAQPVMAATIDAVQRLNGWRLLAVTGPFMPEPLREGLQRRAEGLPVRQVGVADDVPSLMARADVVVARAGYNTTVEACRSGVPTVLVPRAGPSQEQRLRARAFAARGWVTAVEPEDVDGERLAKEIAVAAEAGPINPAEGDGPDLAGLDVAVEALLDLAPTPRVVR